jgi:hypothetical protein
MIKPKLFLISTIGFLCYALGMNYINPQKDPYPGSVASTTKIAKYKDMESKFISQFTFNKYSKPWAGKAVYKGGQRVINNTLPPVNGFVLDISEFLINVPVSKNIDSLNQLAKKIPKTSIISVCIAHPSSYLMPYLHNLQVPSHDFYTKNMYKKEKNISIIEIKNLIENNMYYFYKANRHLSLSGALTVFNSISNMEKITIENLKKTTYKNTSDYMNAYRFNIDTSKDDLVISKFGENLPNAIISNLQYNHGTPTIAFKNDLLTTMQGEHPLLWNGSITRIINNEAKNKEHILILGNSYATYHMPLLFALNYQIVEYSTLNTFFQNHINISDYIINNNITTVFIIRLDPVRDLQLHETLNASLAITDSPPLPDAWVNMKE